MGVVSPGYAMSMTGWPETPPIGAMVVPVQVPPRNITMSPGEKAPLAIKTLILDHVWKGWVGSSTTPVLSFPLVER